MNILGDVDTKKSLLSRLQGCPEISRYDSRDWNESEVLVHAFTDLEESFREFLDRHLPGIASGETTGEKLVDALTDIGEEFRHILYHLQDPRFYKYLQPP